MSPLDEPALGLAGLEHVGNATNTTRVRFLPKSLFAADFGIPPGAEGEVLARYHQDGQGCLYVQVTGGCYAIGVPVDEVAPVERRRDQPDAI